MLCQGGFPQYSWYAPMLTCRLVDLTQEKRMAFCSARPTRNICIKMFSSWIIQSLAVKKNASRFILECMPKRFHWLDNVKYDMCVCCPVCSRTGSVKCRDHDVRGCEYLHFLSESVLRQRQHCNRQGRNLLGDCRIRVKQFECWFSGGEEGEGAGMSTNQVGATPIFFLGLIRRQYFLSSTIFFKLV